MLRFLLAISLCFAALGCERSYGVGDHVLVEWEGNVYPAMIIEIPQAGKVRVHFDGYDEIWDENVRRSRIQGFVEGEVTIPEPPAKVRKTAVAAAKNNEYKIGDHLKAEWHGHYYRAVIIGVVGPERYRIHYEGYGNEWDENVGRSRLEQ